MTTLQLPKKILNPALEKLCDELTEIPGRAATYKQMARILIGMECPRLAARVLRAGLAELPDDQGLLENLARVQQAGGYSTAATRTWRQVKSLFPESFLAYEKLERLYVRSGQVSRAVSMYHRVQEDDPLQEKSLERLVFVCKEAMDVPGTLRALKELVKRYGVTYRRSRDLGRFHFKADHFKEAARWLEKAFALGEGDNDLRLTLALSYARQKKYDLARKQVDSILAERPDSFAALINLCEFAIEEGDLEKAGSVLDQLENLYSGNSRVSLARGEIALLRGDAAVAETALRSGIRGTAYYYRWELERGYRLLGTVLARTVREEEASFCGLLAASLHRAPDAYQAFITLAEDKIGQREVMTAARVLKELARMFPGNSRVIVAEAEVDIFMGYPSKAIEMLNRQLERTPEKFIRDKIKGYRVLGRAYKNLGDWEGARNSFQQADLIEASLS
ncbi:MAG: tetratricopeptide repeat protein [PVC group bacterium]